MSDHRTGELWLKSLSDTKERGHAELSKQTLKFKSRIDKVDDCGIIPFFGPLCERKGLTLAERRTWKNDSVYVFLVKNNSQLPHTLSPHENTETDLQ